ncbi:hypothetical protein GOP47_0018554 [Adiantum capillus-veneris]|uniref:Secreted protein n=1 Tax=Adiantum capillus-veneris TaxID=13818 RepID=A0A9D4UDM2_ADICA|nr:hypothetical protein GOP47_0018554 [Adiantum capillus-veneris]
MPSKLLVLATIFLSLGLGFVSLPCSCLGCIVVVYQERFACYEKGLDSSLKELPFPGIRSSGLICDDMIIPISV